MINTIRFNQNAQINRFLSGAVKFGAEGTAAAFFDHYPFAKAV